MEAAARMVEKTFSTVSADTTNPDARPEAVPFRPPSAKLDPAKTPSKPVPRKTNRVHQLLETELHKPVSKPQCAELLSHIEQMQQTGKPHAADCLEFMHKNPQPSVLQMLACCYLLSDKQFAILDYTASDDSLNFESLMNALDA